MTSYVFDNASYAGAQQLDALGRLLDPFSQRRTCELLDLKGKRCWDIGAGGGSFALWLAEAVGPGGSVLASDIKPQRIPPHPRLERLQHNIVSEEPPADGWDFIHLRCVLSHLPDRRFILRQLSAALAPGGILLDEEWESRPAEHMVALAPRPEDAALFVAYQRHVRALLLAQEHDTTWARAVYAAMVEDSLTEVQTVVWATTWPGGSPGAQHGLATLAQLEAALLDRGMTISQLNRVGELLEDPDFVLHGRLLHSTSGRRAE